MNRAADAMRDPQPSFLLGGAERIGCKMRGGEHRNFLSSSAGRRMPFSMIAAQIDWSLGSRDGQPARIVIVGLKNHCAHIGAFRREGLAPIAAIGTMASNRGLTLRRLREASVDLSTMVL